MLSLPDSIATEEFQSAFGERFLRRCRHWTMMASTNHQHYRSAIHFHWPDDDSLPINFDTPEIEWKQNKNELKIVRHAHSNRFHLIFFCCRPRNMKYVKCCTRTLSPSWAAKCNEFGGYPCNWMLFRWHMTHEESPVELERCFTWRRVVRIICSIWCRTCDIDLISNVNRNFIFTKCNRYCAQ